MSCIQKPFPSPVVFNLWMCSSAYPFISFLCDFLNDFGKMMEMMSLLQMLSKSAVT